MPEPPHRSGQDHDGLLHRPAITPGMIEAEKETELNWWDHEANRGIIGLPPGPWAEDHGVMQWPTHGYDGELVEWNWDAESEQPNNPFAPSGHTREQWLALGDEMIRRWTEWRAFVASLPPA